MRRLTAAPAFFARELCLTPAAGKNGSSGSCSPGRNMAFCHRGLTSLKEPPEAPRVCPSCFNVFCSSVSWAGPGRRLSSMAQGASSLSPTAASCQTGLCGPTTQRLTGCLAVKPWEDMLRRPMKAFPPSRRAAGPGRGHGSSLIGDVRR